MKQTIAASLASMFLLALAACSTMQDKSSTARMGDVEDATYVARVEQTARNRGVTVRWVNPPHRRVPAQF